MIIPVRCMACGKVLADKWEAYVRRCAESGADDDETDRSRPTRPTRPADAPAGPPVQPKKRTQQKQDGGGPEDAVAAAAAAAAAAAGEKTRRGRIMDDLGIVSICCRIAMQTHVDMTLII